MEIASSGCGILTDGLYGMTISGLFELASYPFVPNFVANAVVVRKIDIEIQGLNTMKKRHEYSMTCFNADKLNQIASIQLAIKSFNEQVNAKLAKKNVKEGQNIMELKKKIIRDDLELKTAEGNIGMLYDNFYNLLLAIQNTQMDVMDSNTAISDLEQRRRQYESTVGVFDTAKYDEIIVKRHKKHKRKNPRVGIQNQKVTDEYNSILKEKQEDIQQQRQRRSENTKKMLSASVGVGDSIKNESDAFLESIMSGDDIDIEAMANRRRMQEAEEMDDGYDEAEYDEEDEDERTVDELEKAYAT